jgi:hypothetical protein
MAKVVKLDQTGADPDEGSGLLDEDLDEEDVVRNRRTKKATVTVNVGNLSSVADTNTYVYNTGSMGSIDESTVRTSVDLNSSTNKSSGAADSDDVSQSSSSQSNYTHYTNIS